MTLSATTILVIGVVLLVLIAAGVWAYTAANRLDRLHVRTDLARQSLDAALGRRALVVRTLALDLPGPAAAALSAAATRAERAEAPDSESAQNALAAALAGIDPDRIRPALRAEIADAEARVTIARRFYNDAVRATRALQGRRLVRWLHLAGTAEMPEYFNIIEIVTDPEITAARAADDAAAAAGAAGAAPHGTAPDGETGGPRVSARVVLLDREDRVLLLRGADPAGQSPGEFWFTCGGGVEPGEELAEAAARELEEELGLEITPDRLIGPLWRRRSLFTFDGALLDSEEYFFVLRVDGFVPDPHGLTEREQRFLLEYRWCAADEVRALAAAGTEVYPQDLGELLTDAAAHADGTRSPVLRTVR